MAVVAIACSGCQSWPARDAGLRDSDLSPLVRQARSVGDTEKDNSTDDPRLSEKANKISRDLQ